ncbi:MAG: class D beta-lactamase [Proteobacteria bacterium]|nr:class D beta-lactamase [Pseudomonadota bacterium]
MLTRRTVVAGIPALASCFSGSLHAADIEERGDLADLFDTAGLQGTFAALDLTKARLVVVDRKRAETRFTPASTFKIANSLIALETGVVKDENEIIPYGGKPQPVKAWEHDMGMREALPLSAVPIYQELARRIGLERYRDWLARLDYGNADPGTVVDRFWLDGPLAISAVEQAKFVASLVAKTLPVSDRSRGIVRDLMRLEVKNGRILYGKTGWLTSRTPQIGWWTGWVEHPRGDAIAFSLNVDIGKREDLDNRLPLGKAMLERLRAW